MRETERCPLVVASLDSYANVTDAWKYVSSDGHIVRKGITIFKVKNVAVAAELRAVLAAMLQKCLVN